jgi:hypothetical protein
MREAEDSKYGPWVELGGDKTLSGDCKVGWSNALG